MIVIGVDPGATGAVVALNSNKSVYFVMDYKNLDIKMLNDLMMYTGFTTVGLVAIERQQYMSKGGRRQGARSAFSLGGNFGFWRGYFQGFGCDIAEPRPQEWQRYHFGSGTVISTPKERSIRAALAKLPDLELVPPGCRVPSHGRADAGLIALWALGKIKTPAPVL